MSLLKFLLLADCHGDTTQVAAIMRYLKKRSFRPDATILAGDIGGTVHPSLLLPYIIVHRNLSRNGYANWVFKGSGRRLFEAYQLRSSQSVIKAIQENTDKILAVLGNSDLETAAKALNSQQRKGCSFVDREIVTLNEFQVIGLSGALSSLDEIPICDKEYSPPDFARLIGKLKKRIKQSKSQKIILVTHEGPRLSNFLKYGSQSLTNLIKEIQPSITIFGHHHQAPGIFQIGPVFAINPGPAVLGYFGLMKLSLKDKQVKISVRLYKLQSKRKSFAGIIYSIRDWAISKRNGHSSAK
ncbi:MAG: metallophosphoesterase family protein [Candidatus Hodarchaeales archaeon]|jgi:Icc-related predicted phosphoesterase